MFGDFVLLTKFASPSRRCRDHALDDKANGQFVSILSSNRKYAFLDLLGMLTTDLCVHVAAKL